MENKKELTVTGLIKKHAIEQPEKTALIVGSSSLNYRDLFRKISSASKFFSSIGIKKGSHVLSVASPDLDYIICEYAVLGLGAVHIPAENRIPVERLEVVAKAVDAEFIISPTRPLCDAHWMTLEDIDMDNDADYSWEPVGITADCSEIIFTTGTTGKSKGVMLSSHCLETYLAVMNQTFQLNTESVFLVTTPLNHVGGLHRVHQCMAVGCTAVLLDGIRNLKAFFRAINLHGVTHTYLPPASVKMLLTLAKKELAELNGKLQFIYTASAPFPSTDIETLIKLLPDTRLHQGYGSSETGSICNCRYNAKGETITSLGKPYSCVEVKLLDSEGKVITEPYKEGLICSKSDMNMIGYYNEPELTESVLKNGFIYSKDLMYFDSNGALHFSGRGDDVINVRGFKVSPIEVVDVALRFPMIKDCACVPYDDKALGRCLKMFVVVKEGYAFDVEEVIAFLETKLEAYKIPKYIERISEIPKTYNGKIDRKKLMGML